MASAAARQRQRIRVPLLTIATLAWFGLIAGTVTGLFHDAMVHPVPDPAMNMSSPHTHMETMGHAQNGVRLSGVVASMVGMSALMVVAMMFPIVTLPIAHVRARSFTRRRFRSTGLFLLAYTTIWTVVCTGTGFVIWVVGQHGIRHRWLIVGTIVAGVLWQVSPAKQKCLNRCHGRPVLAAFGQAATFSVLHFGARHAFWCVGSCWALMALPFLAGTWHLATMAIAGLWIAAERLSSPAITAWAFRIPKQPWQAVRARLAQSRPTTFPAI